jgi:hypothetical protein
VLKKVDWHWPKNLFKVILGQFGNFLGQLWHTVIAGMNKLIGLSVLNDTSGSPKS